MELLTHFAPLAARYDGFIVDLWGVLHDGVRPYPGAIDCLLRLRGKPVVLLSNAPRRAEAARSILRGMGIDDGLYTAMVTSGEATYLALRDRTDPWFAGLGQRVFHLGPERDRNVLAGLDLRLVERPDDANFMLNTGPDDESDPTDLRVFEPVLQASWRARLKMVCANPDLAVIRDGQRLLCAGALAVRYEALGGEVRWIGKPDPAIYQPVMRHLGIVRERVLAVGDSLRTDIAGAARAGIDAAWVLGGVDAAAAGMAPATLAAEAGLAPKAVLPRFAW